MSSNFTYARTRFYEQATSACIKVLGEYINCKTPVQIVCPEGHMTAVRPGNIQAGHGWCKYCASRIKNQLRSNAAREKFISRAKADGFTVIGEYVKGNEPITCICPQNHLCKPRPADVLHNTSKGWCWTCRNIAISTRESEIKEFTEFCAVRQITILGEYRNSTTPVKGLCPSGHEWNLRWSALKTGHWCKYCFTRHPFSRVYLISKIINNEPWAKIGIAASQRRIKEHTSKGWITVDVWNNLSHTDCLSIETKVLNIKSTKGWESLLPSDLPQAGYTETFPGKYTDWVRKYIYKEIRKA